MVIAVIGILAALLLPVLGKSKNKAIMMTDIDNLKQQTMAMQLYAWIAATICPGRTGTEGVDPAGLALRYDPTANGQARFKVETGLFWPTLKNLRLYLCPMDNTNTPLFAQREQQISS